MSEIQSALVSEDSLMNQSSGTTGYDFDTESDRGMIRSVHIQNASITNAKIGTAAIDTANIKDLAVTSAKINNFSFNQGTGGTLTLGGTTNGNGILKVNNSGGTEVVRIDNSGIAVTNGNISIQDANGTTILDATGLVSTANFQADSITGGNFNTTSTSYTDITSVTLTLTVARSSRVLVISSARMASTGMLTGESSTVCLNIDGVDQVGPAIVEPGYDYGGGLIFQTGAVSTIQTLTVGTHTLKLRVKSSNGAATAYGNQANLTYLVLGK